MNSMTFSRGLFAAASSLLLTLAACGGNGSDPGVPNQCSSELASLLEGDAGGSSPSIATVPFQIQGGDAWGDEFTFQGTYQGVAELGSSVELDCFEGAAEMGLQCSTDKALQFAQISDGGPNAVISVVTALPVSEIQLPATGTAVNVIVDRNEPSSLVVRRLQSQDDNLVFGQNLIRGDMQTGGPDSFQEVFGPFDISMEADYDDASTASCITHDDCPRLYRLEPLTFAADTAVQVETASRGSVEALGGNWSVWNVVSARRNDELADAAVVAPDTGGYCEDITQPFVSIAVAPEKAPSSGE